MSGRKITMSRIAFVAASGWLFLLAMRAPGEGPVAPRDPMAAAAAFEALAPALRNPRCMNCHSTGDCPRQGNDSHRHTMDVRRGPDGNGVNAVKCSTCHQDHNTVGARTPPGAPDWHLPSPAMPMIWEGLTDRQLCELLKDPKQNGNRTRRADRGAYVHPAGALGLASRRRPYAHIDASAGVPGQGKRMGYERSSLSLRASLAINLSWKGGHIGTKKEEDDHPGSLTRAGCPTSRWFFARCGIPLHLPSNSPSNSQVIRCSVRSTSVVSHISRKTSEMWGTRPS